MPKSVNEIVVGGHITSPKQSGRGPVRFSINTGSGKKQDGGEWPAEWHRIVAWPSKLPDALKLEKGQHVTVTGRLAYPVHDPQRESVDDFVRWGHFCEIVATSLVVSSWKPKEEAPKEPEIPESEIPF